MLRQSRRSYVMSGLVTSYFPLPRAWDKRAVGEGKVTWRGVHVLDLQQSVKA